ncbi:MAG TPA: asparagine synthase (glutamine-hydrolyzing), partial [Candidatus Sulfopaludibacter sp.]|nr:asparagine synthase (glutamine-hydrolyzing) [Candidatus Sulfopaludibacter sp.]
VILFGSELKSIMLHPSFQKNIDFNALGSFLRHGWIAAPYTIFESTFKLKPGHYFEINLNNRKTKEYCYWNVHDFYNMENRTISFDDAKEELHVLLKSACEYRMVADTEVGIFLSGGFDSSTVAAILQSSRSKKINTFSIGFEEEKFNEAPFAKAVANHLGTNHHEVICTAKDALELISDLPYFYDEPFADSSAIPTMLVSKLASTKVKVSLSADGGDEIFGGYPRYYDNMGDFNKVMAIPDILRKLISKLLWLPMNLTKSRNPLYQVRLEKLKRSLEYKKPTDIFRFRSEPFKFSDKEIRQLLKEKNINLALKTYYDDIDVLNSTDPASIMMALEYKTTLVDDVLVKVDRATMAYSLEGREPFLDHRLVEFSARFNRDYHYRNMNTKSLLREICYQYIPKELMDRPKKGFAIPTDKWLNNELKDMVMEFSRTEFIKKQGIFETKSCARMINNYYRGFDHDGERIWFFLMFQMWYNKWMV